jgi:spore germination protein
MSGRWTKIVAAVSLAVVLGGCNPTAAPNKNGTAAEPLRRSASRVTRGTDRMIRGSTARGGNTTTTNRGGLFGMFSGSNTRTGYRTGTGTGNYTGRSTTNRLGANGMTGTGTTAGRGATGAATTRNRNLWGALGGTTGVGRGKTGGSMSASKGNMARTGSGTGAFYFGKKGRIGATASRLGSTAASRVRRAAGGTTQGPLHVIGFFTEDASASGLTALGRDPKALSYLSPWWYTLQSDGSVKDSSTAATRSWVKSHNVPVVPLVTNGGQSQVLTNNSAMKTAISNLVSLVDKNNYAGLNVDFQLLPSTARSGLSAFVDDLASQLHAKGKIVSVDIIPTAAQTGAGGAYDEVTLSHYADQLILMTYDHHDDSSPAGPVSPHAWVVSSVQHALNSGVPANKIFLGVNDYGYDWPTGGKGVTIGQKVATTLPGTKTYDPTTKEMKVTYTKNGQQHVVYYGGRQGLADKVAIARQYKLYGIAIWKVGYENQAYWSELLKVNGDAASLQSGASSSTAPSAAFKSKKHGKKPITHRPIGKKTGRMSPAKMKKSTGKHAGTARSHSGKKRGMK